MPAGCRRGIASGFRFLSHLSSPHQTESSTKTAVDRIARSPGFPHATAASRLLRIQTVFADTRLQDVFFEDSAPPSLVSGLFPRDCPCPVPAPLPRPCPRRRRTTESQPPASFVRTDAFSSSRCRVTALRNLPASLAFAHSPLGVSLQDIRRKSRFFHSCSPSGYPIGRVVGSLPASLPFAQELRTKFAWEESRSCNTRQPPGPRRARHRSSRPPSSRAFTVRCPPYRR